MLISTWSFISLSLSLMFVWSSSSMQDVNSDRCDAMVNIVYFIYILIFLYNIKFLLCLCTVPILYLSVKTFQNSSFVVYRLVSELRCFCEFSLLVFAVEKRWFSYKLNDLVNIIRTRIILLTPISIYLSVLCWLL